MNMSKQILHIWVALIALLLMLLYFDSLTVKRLDQLEEHHMAPADSTVTGSE